MDTKLLIVVPYRNREEHLSKFIEYIIPEIKQQNIIAKIIIVEQDDTNPFNRGLLCNAGFHYFYENYNYVCFHDVDMIGETFDYSYEDKVTHLSSMKKINDESYENCYDKYLGGVVLFPNNLFLKINGFSNIYWGWGCEDDDLFLRCYTHRIDIYRKMCKYYTLPHKKNLEKISYKKNYTNLVYNYRLPYSKKIESFLSDGTNNIDQHIHSQSSINYENYTLLKIKTKYENTDTTKI